MVLISKQERRRVYEELMKEGVLVLKKDWTEKEHPVLKGISPLKIWMLMRSLKSKDLVSEIFNWNYFYFFLLKEGLEHIRQELLIEANVEPITHLPVNRTFIINDGKGERRREPRGDKPDGRKDARGRGRKGAPTDNANPATPAETPAATTPAE